MENIDFTKRIQDLAARCERTSCVTRSGFLTPAEAFSLRTLPLGVSVQLLLSGGREGCERQVAFFLPDWLEPELFDPSEEIRAVCIRSFFGTPGHRDYLGAILGLGIERDRIGDIVIQDSTAWVFCLSGVAGAILQELDKVGRCGAKTAEVPLAEVPLPELRIKKLSFTVKSLRLDAVTGDLFGVSRTSASELIRLGAVSLNYAVCEKPDAPVKEGDILSVRGKGKGRIAAVGGRSKKDRLFLEAELYL